LESRLNMTQRVDVRVVPADEKMVSVRRMPGDVFMISIDQGFFSSLTHEELRAAIAHELGHVWISSHHPYLQTEALANEIAMRAVTRQSMKSIYAKLWLHLGAPGDLDELLGSASAARD